MDASDEIKNTDAFYFSTKTTTTNESNEQGKKESQLPAFLNNNNDDDHHQLSSYSMHQSILTFQAEKQKQLKRKF